MVGQKLIPLKGMHLTGEKRIRARAALKRDYEKGKSIRELAAMSGLSYGSVHNLLKESGMVLRGRGGNMRGQAPVSATQDMGGE